MSIGSGANVRSFLFPVNGNFYNYFTNYRTPAEFSPELLPARQGAFGRTERWATAAKMKLGRRDIRGERAVSVSLMRVSRGKFWRCENFPAGRAEHIDRGNFSANWRKIFGRGDVFRFLLCTTTRFLFRLLDRPIGMMHETSIAAPTPLKAASLVALEARIDDVLVVVVLRGAQALRLGANVIARCQLRIRRIDLVG